MLKHDSYGASYFKAQTGKYLYFYFERNCFCKNNSWDTVGNKCYCFLNFLCARDQSICENTGAYFCLPPKLFRIPPLAKEEIGV